MQFCTKSLLYWNLYESPFSSFNSVRIPCFPSPYFEPSYFLFHSFESPFFSLHLSSNHHFFPTTHYALLFFFLFTHFEYFFPSLHFELPFFSLLFTSSAFTFFLGSLLFVARLYHSCMGDQWTLTRVTSI